MTVNDGIIQKKVLIEASPGIVYRALIEARSLMRWFCDRVSSDPREGGELKAYWRSSQTSGRAVFTRLVPESLVELRWIYDDPSESGGEPVHIISYSIRRRKNTTEVTLRDEGQPPPDDETFSLLDEGWIDVLRSLKDYCENQERSARRRTGL